MNMNNTDLNELVNVWNNSDTELETTLKINRELVAEVSTGRIKALLSEIKLSSIIEIVVNTIFMFFLMGFLVDHFLIWKYSIPAGMLMGLTIFSLLFNGHKLSLFNKIDTKVSVLETQRAMERLRYLDLMETNTLYVIIPLFSSAFLIVLAKAFLNYDLYNFDQYFAQFMLGSFFVAVIIVFFLKKFPNRKLRNTISFLREIKDFNVQK